MRIGLVAGESSGDLLGARLIEQIRRQYPNANFEGVTGPAMEAAGCTSLASIERLSVMGLAEVLGHLSDLLKLRGELVTHFTANPPDVLIGIDAPDFNLGLERRLRKRKIRTVHYVSPTIWAWRPGRVKGIARAADMVLCLFPFEPQLYARHGVDAVFVGHPLTHEIPADPDPAPLRDAFNLRAAGGPVLAVLPGSRMSEMQRLGPVFIDALKRLAARGVPFQAVAPMASSRLAAEFQVLLDQRAPDLPVSVMTGRSRDAMAAADAVLLASGTATLEATLLERPMVVAYRVNALTHFLLRRLGLLKVERVALPNILADRDVVAECLQQDANPDRLADELAALLEDPENRSAQRQALSEIRAQLADAANDAAANAVLALAET